MDTSGVQRLSRISCSVAMLGDRWAATFFLTDSLFCQNRPEPSPCVPTCIGTLDITIGLWRRLSTQLHWQVVRYKRQLIRASSFLAFPIHFGSRLCCSWRRFGRPGCLAEGILCSVVWERTLTCFHHSPFLLRLLRTLHLS